MAEDFTNQWYDIEYFTKSNKVQLVRQVYDSDVESNETRIRLFRIVHKDNILPFLSIVSNADTVTGLHFNKMWLGTPLK